jgi:hypothetical protein
MEFDHIFLNNLSCCCCQEWLTRGACARRLICRGLNRACCVQLLDPILAFLTSAGYINVGLVTPPPELTLDTDSQVSGVT